MDFNEDGSLVCEHYDETTEDYSEYTVSDKIMVLCNRCSNDLKAEILVEVSDDYSGIGELDEDDVVELSDEEVELDGLDDEIDEDDTEIEEEPVKVKKVAKPKKVNKVKK